jgi:hypothetical protein
MVDHDVETVLTAYARENARKRAHDLTKTLAMVQK